MDIDKVICAGKNYHDHIVEMNDSHPEKPVLFLKPGSVLQQVTQWNTTQQLHYLSARGSLHYECEVVLRIARDGFQLTRENAWNYIDAFSLGLDMTLRDEQNKLKKAGHPWEISKVFVD